MSKRKQIVVGIMMAIGMLSTLLTVGLIGYIVGDCSIFDLEELGYMILVFLPTLITGSFMTFVALGVRHLFKNISSIKEETL